MPEIRYFTESGRSRWLQWLEEMRADPAKGFPDALLADPIYTRRISEKVFLPDVGFSTKYSMAQTLAPAVQLVRESKLPEAAWPGLWDWLAAYYFNSICPCGPDGKRAPKDLIRYSLASAWNRRYRHRVYGPVDLFMRLGNSSKLLIYGDPSTLSDWEEQTASRYQISANRGIADALFRLYWDPVKEAPKKGAAPNNNKKEGTLRRFGIVMQQLDRTYDLLSIDAEAILQLLPKEFKKFHQKRFE